MTTVPVTVMQGTYLAFIVQSNEQKAQILAVGVAFLFAIIVPSI